MSFVIKDILVFYATGDVLLRKQFYTDDIVVGVSDSTFIDVC